MRRPTPPEIAENWWRRSLTGERVPVVEDEPQVGFYRRRLVRGGPWVPGRIWIESIVDERCGELLAPEVYRCEVDGKPRDAYREWVRLANNPITEAAHADLVQQHAANARMAASLVPFDHDFDTLPPRPSRGF